jgi:anti-sigma B factor antagonist
LKYAGPGRGRVRGWSRFCKAKSLFAHAPGIAAETPQRGSARSWSGKPGFWRFAPKRRPNSSLYTSNTPHSFLFLLRPLAQTARFLYNNKISAGGRFMINVSFEGAVAIISFDVDHIDSSNNKEFKSMMQHYMTEGARFIFNIEALKFIDSSGLGAFLSILRDLRTLKGAMVMYGAGSAVKILFDLVQLSKVIQVFPDKDQALRALA